MQVLYGLDFIQKEREQQLRHVRDAVIAHIKDNPEPLIVIEEYDKLDCDTRAFLRQLLQHPELANTTFNRCGMHFWAAVTGAVLRAISAIAWATPALAVQCPSCC